MPKKALKKNKVITNTISDVEITGIVEDFAQEKVEIHYMVFLSDGTPYQRNHLTIDNSEAAKAKKTSAGGDTIYTEIDFEIAQGKTFEDARNTVFYNKVLDSFE